jgi:hypothetical protein
MKKRKYTKEWSSVKRTEEVKKANKGLLWTIFISVIMVSSIIGYMWIGGNEPEFEYNGHKIARDNNGFIYTKDGNSFMFKFFPSELEGLANQTDTGKIKKPMFYVTFDPNSGIVESVDLLRFDFSNELPKLNVYISSGVLNQSKIYNLSVIDCVNSTENIPVVKFLEANETKISEEGSCIIVEAKNNYDVIKIRDLILYSILGVI